MPWTYCTYMDPVSTSPNWRCSQIWRRTFLLRKFQHCCVKLSNEIQGKNRMFWCENLLQNWFEKPEWTLCIKLCRSQSLFFLLFKARPQFLIMDMFTLKPLKLRIIVRQKSVFQKLAASFQRLPTIFYKYMLTLQS